MIALLAQVSESQNTQFLMSAESDKKSGTFSPFFDDGYGIALLLEWL